jgi:cofilin
LVLESTLEVDHTLTTGSRSPDDAKIKQKMLFASSRDALRRSLVGIAVEIQGTDYSEVSWEYGEAS